MIKKNGQTSLNIQVEIGPAGPGAEVPGAGGPGPGPGAGGPVPGAGGSGPGAGGPGPGPGGPGPGAPGPGEGAGGPGAGGGGMSNFDVHSVVFLTLMLFKNFFFTKAVIKFIATCFNLL